MVRKLREEKGISMSAVASDLGVSVALVSDIERGYAQPGYCLSVEQVERYAELLGVAPAVVGDYLSGLGSLEKTIGFTLEAIRSARVSPQMPDGHRHIPCPKCGGELVVGIARHNGHTNGQCKTQGCLSWIE